MKVLLLGATGNVGSRVLPALLAHNHEVVVYVRSEPKLRELVPAPVLSKTTAIVCGDAEDSTSIRDALVSNRCNAIVNTAGLAAVFPWQAPRMQGIIHAVTKAGVEASEIMGYSLRCWFLGGMTVLDLPGRQGTRISRYLPILLDHGHTYDHLRSQPAANLQWSLLAPSQMTPATPGIELLEKPRGNSLITGLDCPPEWKPSMLDFIPFLGGLISCATNASKYATKLDDNADLIAADLASGDVKFVGRRVGVIESKKGKAE